MMPDQPRKRLEEFAETDSKSLLKTLRFYILRAGLAAGAAVDSAASELLNEIMIEAFEHADRLTPDTSLRPWLLGVAANLIKRKQVELSKRNRREPLMRDLYPQTQDAMSDEELFDQLPVVAALDPVEVDEKINNLLMGVAKSDADLLRLAILHDLDGEALAKELGITPGAARVRLHRALNRLREAQRNRADE
jgi:RNA polymerase sigma factor (sigma-70 family)